MKLPSTALDAKVYEALNGNITVSGAVIPVERVGCVGTYPVIIKGEVTSVDDPFVKGNFTMTVTQAYVAQSIVSEAEADEIASRLLEILIPSPKGSLPFDMSPDFKLWTVSLDTSVKDQDETSYGTVKSNFIRIRYRILES